MKDIIDSIKAEIKEHKAATAKLEAALAKLEGDKAPKATASGKRSTSPSSNASTQDSSGKPEASLPDRIIAELAARDEQPADSLAEGLKAPIGQVRTTCSRLAREGRISSVKRGGTTFYLALKGETATDNPFADGAN